GAATAGHAQRPAGRVSDGGGAMTLRLVLRTLAARPVRTAVLAGGFGFGVAVMASLLGVGDVILEQSRSAALRGGGDLVVVGRARPATAPGRRPIPASCCARWTASTRSRTRPRGPIRGRSGSTSTAAPRTARRASISRS